MTAGLIVSICFLILSVIVFACTISYTVYCLTKIKKSENYSVVPFYVNFVISMVVTIASAICGILV